MDFTKKVYNNHNTLYNCMFPNRNFISSLIKQVVKQAYTEKIATTRAAIV